MRGWTRRENDNKREIRRTNLDRYERKMTFADVHAEDCK